MRRAIVPLSILLVVQLAVALLLSMRRDPLAGARVDTPLVQAGVVKAADQIVISSVAGAQTTHVELARKGGTWVLPEQFDAPADASRVNLLLDHLSTLKRGLPVATSDAALKRFKLVDSDFERRVVMKGGGKTLDTLYFGSSPGLRKSDARSSADHAVYAVDLPTYELPTDVGSWLDADLLRSDTAKLAELDVGGASGDKLQLVRQTSGAGGSSSSSGGGGSPQTATWTDPELAGSKRIDSTHADALVQDLSDVHTDAVLGTAPKAEWQQDHPALTVALKDDNAHSVDWTLSKPSSGDFYVLKSSAHPWYFSISSAQGQALVEAGGRDQLIVATKADTKAEAKPTGKT
ncbi:MAG TPA: DUF4340 domain-containing protein [Steroidobacteraceae bacterium]|jgi:hypothetical protein